MSGIGARAEAANLLVAVIGSGKSLNHAWDKLQIKISDARDRAFIQEICFGVLRWYWRLRYFTDTLLKRPPHSRDTDVLCLIWMGMYQLSEMRVPSYAAISETVGAARAIGKPWAVGLINGVLREFQRKFDDLQFSAVQNDTSRYAFPSWLLEKMRMDWPQNWQSVADILNQRPQMYLRVRGGATQRARYLSKFSDANIDASPHPTISTAICLEQARDVHTIPGFANGGLSVQDPGAQIAAPLLDPKPGDRVLDVCAAPGGKSCHILEYEPKSRLTALEIDPARVVRLKENLERCKLSAIIRQVDATRIDQWWDKIPFQCILLDAPCSGTGVIRRHPDIKLLRKSTDIPHLIQRQRDLLRAVWSLLAPGGTLLYATCSILKAENQGQMELFLSNTADAVEVKIEPQWGVGQIVGRQALPSIDQMDGFYYAKLKKR